MVWFTIWRNPNFGILWNLDSWILHHGIHLVIQTLTFDLDFIGILCLTFYHWLEFWTITVVPWVEMLLVALYIWVETLIIDLEVDKLYGLLWGGLETLAVVHEIGAMLMLVTSRCEAFDWIHGFQFWLLNPSTWLVLIGSLIWFLCDVMADGYGCRPLLQNGVHCFLSWNLHTSFCHGLGMYGNGQINL